MRYLQPPPGDHPLLTASAGRRGTAHRVPRKGGKRESAHQVTAARQSPTPPRSDRPSCWTPSGCRSARELLERALTHRSFAYENGGLPTNERLEFLGDSVLGLIVTDTLFREYPDLPEGQLAKLRAAVVNMRALAGVARGLQLGSYVRLGKGEEGTGGRDKASILADTLEAVLGAVYLDCGLSEADALVHRLFDPVIARSARLGAGLDWKTSLQELTAAETAGRARVPRRGERPGPPEVVPRLGQDRRAHLRRGRGPVQEGGRAAGGGGGVDRRSPRATLPRAPPTATTAKGRRRRGSSRSGSRGGAPTAEGTPLGALNGAGSTATARNRGARRARASRSRDRPARSRAAHRRPHHRDGRRPCIRARCAGTWPGPTISPPPLPAARISGALRRGQVPVAAGRRGRAARSPGHERPVAGRRPAAPAVAARPGPPHLHRLAGPTCASATSGRSATCRSCAGGAVLPGPIAHIAPDPLEPVFDLAAVTARIRARRSGIKRALLDQSLVSGIGNIYADEALWRAQMHWAGPPSCCGPPQINRLFDAVQRGVRRVAQRGRHLVRQPVRQRKRPERLLRAVAQTCTGGRASRAALRDADAARPVHEPVRVQLPEMPAAPPGEAVIRRATKPGSPPGWRAGFRASASGGGRGRERWNSAWWAGRRTSRTAGSGLSPRARRPAAASCSPCSRARRPQDGWSG